VTETQGCRFLQLSAPGVALKDERIVSDWFLMITIDCEMKGLFDILVSQNANDQQSSF
jgi:hypothetical protein